MERRFAGSWSGYERDKYFHNVDGPFPRWFDAAYVAGLDFDDDGRSVVAVDVDGDGDLELAMQSLQGLHLLENTSAARRFARVSLDPAGAASPVPGAVVRLGIAGSILQRYANPSDGFLAQQPSHLHFGLGDARSVDWIEVSWPSGKSERWKDLPVDRLIRLREGDPTARVEELPRWPETGRPAEVSSLDVSVELPLIDGSAGALRLPGKPLVAHFWAPSCSSCREELASLGEVSARHGGAVAFATVLVNPAELEEARGLLQPLGGGWRNFTADQGALQRIFRTEAGIALPTTAVFDEGGALRRVFRRPAAPAELDALLASLAAEATSSSDLVLVATQLLQKQDYAAALDALRRASPLRPRDAQVAHLTGLALVGLRREADAVAEFRRAVDLDPGFAQALVNYGVSLANTGRAVEAVEQLERAIRLQGERGATLAQLGNALAAARRLPAALDAFNRAIRADERLPEAWLGKGKTHLLAGEKAEARRCLKRVLELAPGHAEAAGLLGQIRD